MTALVKSNSNLVLIAFISNSKNIGTETLNPATKQIRYSFDCNAMAIGTLGDDRLAIFQFITMGKRIDRSDAMDIKAKCA